MSNLKIIRHMDKQGRIIIPKDIRRILDIHEEDIMFYTNENGEVVIKKYEGELK